MAKNDRDGLRTSAFRVPPQAIEVEKHVLGALFLDNEAMEDAFKVLAYDDFYLEKNQYIFEAAVKLWEARKQVDLITIGDELKKSGRFELAGGDSWLMEISREVVSSANVGQHSEIIKEKSVLRKIIHTATRILEGAYDGEKDPKEILQIAGDSLYKLEAAARGASEGLVPIRTHVYRAAENFDAIAAGKEMRTRFGIGPIDDVIQGFRFSSVNILAARPGIGKSAILLQAAVACGKPVPIFSMEMLAQEEVERMMAHIDPSLNSDGVATQAQIIAKRHLIKAVLDKIAEYPIEICENPEVTIAYIRSEVRRMLRKYGAIGFTLIDYLQMIKFMGKFERHDLGLASISNGLKGISHETNAPVVAAASLSRECEKRENKRPVESDLRDSGKIESDAHCIILLYKEAKYNPKAAKDARIKDILEVDMPKNRGGRTGRTMVNFKGHQSWCFPVSHEDQNYYRDFLKGKFLEEGEDPQALKKTTGTPRGSRKQKPATSDGGAWDVDVPPLV